MSEPEPILPTSRFSWTDEVRPICELGLSDQRQPDPDEWQDISCHVHEAELFRGRERFNDRFQPGTASITFDNDDGWADLPGQPANVVNRPLRPGRQIRIGVRGRFSGGDYVNPHPPLVTRWLWYGYIDQVVPAYDPVLHDIVTANCIDALGEAGQVTVLPGPSQGVNEVVHERMHRALSAGKWWYTKRAIKPGTALMQGTTLGSQVMDLLSVAADSAGGVVYGDLVGNVVYKDIDWMLYDPTYPPDGEIGNCRPGVPPPPYSPPYHDPRPGPPVYDPGPDPPAHPPGPIEFCVGPGTGGTIIERGETYKIYIAISPADGHQHLYYEEYGRTWDLGVWEPEGGCAKVTPPVPPSPTDPPDTPPTPPIREPTPCLGCPPDGPPIIGSPVDPTDPTDPPTEPPETQFGVELLGFADGNASVDMVAVTGISPGPGALLVCLICALADDIPAGSLKPWPLTNGSITGPPDVTWDEIDSEVSGGSGAETYAAVTRTGRNDPGAFDVVVDWSEDHRSRQHIVTVWKVTHEVPEMLERMVAGDYIRAFTWDRVSGVLPDPINPPGKGPFALPFEAPDPGQLPIDPGFITIAQSLAENHEAPYGATFDDSEGVWWTPEFGDAPEPPAVAALAAAAGGFTDDFERADGPPGPDWTKNPLSQDSSDIATDAFISGGTLTTALDTGGAAIHDWATYHVAQEAPVAGGRFIEVDVVTGSSLSFYLYTQMNEVDFSRQYCYVQFNVPPTTTYQYDFGHIPAVNDGGADVSIDSGSALQPADGTVIKFRFESDDDGTMRLFIDGTKVLENTDPAPVTGQPFVGFSMNRRITDAVPTGFDSFATGGGVVCDDFERADGPVGADWVLWAPVTVNDSFVIDAGAAVVPLHEPSDTLPPSTSYMHWHEAQPDDQAIEVSVENVLNKGAYINLRAHVNDADFASQSVEFWFYEDGEFYVAGYSSDYSGATTTMAEVSLPSPPTEPVSLRFESDASGAQRALVDGALVLSWTDPSFLAGHYVVMGSSVTTTIGSTYTSPRILDACIGGAPGGGGEFAWCDEFDRAELGTDWTMGPLFYGQSASPPTLVDGHLEGDEDTGLAPGAHVQVSLMTTAPWPEDQVIEVVFANLYQGFVDGVLSTEGDCMLVAKADPTTNEHVLAFAQFTLGDNNGGPPEDPASWPGACYVQLYYVQPDGRVDPVAGVIGSGTVSGFEWASNPEFRLRLSAIDGHVTCTLDDQFVCEGLHAGTVVGDRVGFGFEWRDAHNDTGVESTSFWAESACVDTGTVGGIVRKCSWVAGWRGDASTSDVKWAEVNLGDADIQSCQACVVIEPLTPDTAAADDGTGALTIGGATDAFTGPIFGARGLDADGSTVLWEFDPADYAGTDWVVDPATIVAGTDDGGVGYFEPGSVCPTTWNEDFDRSQMSTQVLIGHTTPSDVPKLRYYFPGSFADPPPVGQITLDAPQQTATRMRVSKIGVGGLSAEHSVWLRYIRKDDTVTLTSVARSDPDDNNKSRGYRVTGNPIDHAGHVEWPIFWTDGTTAFEPGAVDLTLGIRGEAPRIWQDTFGVDHYGAITYNRTDLIRVDPLDDPIYRKLADRILEVRGSNSVPRLESVTIDARTAPDWYPIHHMNLMSSVDPAKPSRYLCCLKVSGRTIFHQLCFASGVRHVINRDEWSTTITLDRAEWAGTL